MYKIAYILYIGYRDGDTYSYKSKSKLSLIKFRKKVIKNTKNSFTPVIRTKFKLISEKEYKELHAEIIK